MRRCKRAAYGVAAVFLLAGAASGAPPVVTLPNGLRVVVSEERGSGRVGLVLMVRAGDADDAEGTARILSRVLAAPDNHGDAGRWARAEVSGAEWTVTEPDVTTFNITTTPDQMDGAVRRLGLTVSEPVWNRTLVMRSVRLEAEADHEEPPDAWTQDFQAWQAEAGIPAPPPASLLPPNRDGLRALYRRLYTPDRMVLAVVGDVGVGAVEAAARAAFTEPASSAARLAPRRSRAVTPERRDPTGSYAFVGVKAPPATAPDAPAVEVLAAALGLGKTSGLFQHLRERGGRGYESGVVYPRRFTDSGLALYALAPGRAAGMRDDLLDVWNLAGSTPEEGWPAARARAAHAYAAQHQTARDRAYWLAFWELSGKGAAYDDGFAVKLRSISDSAIAAAARRYFTGPPSSLP